MRARRCSTRMPAAGEKSLVSSQVGATSCLLPFARQRHSRSWRMGAKHLYIAYNRGLTPPTALRRLRRPGKPHHGDYYSFAFSPLARSPTSKCSTLLYPPRSANFFDLYSALSCRNMRFLSVSPRSSLCFLAELGKDCAAPRTALRCRAPQAEVAFNAPRPFHPKLRYRARCRTNRGAFKKVVPNATIF